MATIFDEARVSELVLKWQKAKDAEAKAELWAQIVAECKNCLSAIIRTYKWPLADVGTHEEILAELVLQLHKLLDCFKPSRGRFYSFLVRCSLNYLSTLRDKARRYSNKYTVTDFTGWDEALVPVSQPQVYSRAYEIRERLEHFTRAEEDFEFFLTRNLVLYAYQRKGRKEPPSSEEITSVVAEICRLSPEDAQARTNEALELLRRELRDLGVTVHEPGRPAAGNRGVSQLDRTQ